MNKSKLFQIVFSSALLVTMGSAWADLPWTTIPTPRFPMPQPRFPKEASVPGFDPTLHSVWFANYSAWEGSSLPEVAQVPHCTGLALLARQVFQHAEFDASQDRPSPEEMERLLKKIYRRDSRYLPGDVPKVVIPGYLLSLIHI